MKWVLLLASIVIFLVSPSLITINAHTDGPSFEKVVGDNLIDIGYSSETFESGIPSTFSFDLLNADTGEQVDFDYVWVRVLDGGQTDFAAGVKKQELGATTMIYTFSYAKNYNVDVRYQKGDENIAEAVMPIDVVQASAGPFDKAEPESEEKLKLIGAVAAGLATGAVITYFLRNKND